MVPVLEDLGIPEEESVAAGRFGIPNRPPGDAVKHPKRSLCLTLAGIAAFTGCQAPKAVSKPWHEGAASQVESRGAGLPAADQALYREGFLEGVKMVREAQQRGIRPFLPLFADDAEAPQPRGALPKDLALLVPAPNLEIDPETGLEIRRVGGAGSSAFAKGQSDGFRWAWDQVRAGFTARKAPEPPKAWAPWPEANPQVELALGPVDLRVSWSAGRLFWELRNAGFPPQRRWRAFPWGQPILVALGSEVLWVVPQGQPALAMDLDSGVVRATLQAPAPPKPIPPPLKLSGLLAVDLEDSAAHAERLLRLRKEAEGGQAKAMLELAEALRRGDEPGPLEEARARWILRAAEAGNPEAMMNIAGRYLGGAGLPMSTEIARSWYERAAKAGHPDAPAVLQELSM